MSMTLVDETAMDSIRVYNDHACRRCACADSGTGKIIVPKVDYVLEIREVDGLEEATIPALYPVEVKMAMGLLDAG